MAKSYNAGWDHFTPDPGTEKEMFCRVCKSKMKVKRNVNGPTGFVEAMGKHKHLHDEFWCEFAQEDWHNQARVLKEKIEKEPSAKITKILKKEVKQILETKQITKEGPWKCR